MSSGLDLSLRRELQVMHEKGKRIGWIEAQNAIAAQLKEHGYIEAAMLVAHMEPPTE